MYEVEWAALFQDLPVFFVLFSFKILGMEYVVTKNRTLDDRPCGY